MKYLPAILLALVAFSSEVGCDSAITWDNGCNACSNGKCPAPNKNSLGFYNQDPKDVIHEGQHDIKMYDGGQFVETPEFNIPPEMRMKNYAGGSCVHASTEMVLRWQGEEAKADYWRKTYSGGESLGGLVSKMQKEGMTYAYTGNGDVQFLEWLNRTRRGGVIFYYPNHSICFAGFSPDGKTAFVLDNNRLDNFILIPKEEFISRWKGYGGVALTLINLPAAPMMWVN